MAVCMFGAVLYEDTFVALADEYEILDDNFAVDDADDADVIDEIEEINSERIESEETKSGEVENGEVESEVHEAEDISVDEAAIDEIETIEYIYSVETENENIDQAYSNATDYCIKFQGENAFSLDAILNTDSILQYSTDGVRWNEWQLDVNGGANNHEYETINSSDSYPYVLYLRGYEGTYVSGRYVDYWGKETLGGIKPSEQVTCSGNIMTLLEYCYVEKNWNIQWEDGAFQALFYYSNITTAPELPMMVLKPYSYAYMFYGCQYLNEAPKLPATLLADYCYYSMFSGCTSLIDTPELISTSLAPYCYSYMFSNCKSLFEVTDLPAESMEDSCYKGMFAGCVSITNASELPAVYLADSCYAHMYFGCSSLLETPKLPATVMKKSCYSHMFESCTSLESIPMFNHVVLADFCFGGMFEGCTKLALANSQSDTYSKEWSIDAEGEALNWNSEMFKDCLGVETINPEAGVTYYTKYVEGELLPEKDCCIKFEADSAFTVSGMMINNGSLEYSIDGVTWKNWSKSSGSYTTISSSTQAPYVLFVRGKKNSYLKAYTYEETIYGMKYTRHKGFIFSKSVSCSGDIMNLLDYQCVQSGTDIVMADNCFEYLFYASSIITAPSLTSKKLSQGCYSYMFATSTLTVAPELPAKILTDSCYLGMFYQCYKLTEASRLDATQLAPNCYEKMFYSTTALTKMPELPATTLAAYCYYHMFYYSSIAGEIELPAVNLAPGCYKEMFHGCKNISSMDVLPATVMEANCYEKMFYSCTGITAIPYICATKLADSCFENMFYGCDAVGMSSVKDEIYTEEWTISAPEEASNWAKNMFGGCPGVEDIVPILGKTYYRRVWDFPENYNDATAYCVKFESDRAFTMTSDFECDGVVEYSVDGSTWTRWVDSARLTRTISSSATEPYTIYVRGKRNTYVRGYEKTSSNISGYSGFVFSRDVNCSGNILNLLDYSVIRNEFDIDLADNCFEYLFYKASILTSPELPSKRLSDKCYYMMFCGSHLSVAPTLPASELGEYCYSYMFKSTYIDEAPELSADVMKTGCYSGMFSNTKLKKAPELNAMELEAECYSYMFENCADLEKAPELPALILKDKCYFAMFRYCKMLTDIPNLPATQVANNCYQYMFNGCANVFLSETPSDEFCVEWKIEAENTANQWKSYMFNLTSKCCVSEPVAGKTYYRRVWDRPDDYGDTSAYCIKFTGDSNFELQGPYSADGSLQYSLDGTTWTTWTKSSYRYSTIKSTKKVIYIRGTGNTYVRGTNWYFDSTTYVSNIGFSPSIDVECSGNIMTLLDYDAVMNKLPITMGDKCFEYLFYHAYITTAPELPADNLSIRCYSEMFAYSDLKTAPKLPAVVMKESCYSGMFRGTDITESPELQSESLAKNCYSYMFSGCSGLKDTPELPAMVMATGCYNAMFKDCIGLTKVPNLPATALNSNCYAYMFSGCTGLKLLDHKDGAYSKLWIIRASSVSGFSAHMFDDCENVDVTAPETYCYYYQYDPEYVAQEEINELDYCIKFTGSQYFSLSKPASHDGLLEFSRDGRVWSEWNTDNVSVIYSSSLEPYVLYIRGVGNSYVRGDNINALKPSQNAECEGDIMTLLDYKSVAKNEKIVMADNCFYQLFSGAFKLLSSPDLTATTLSEGCYMNMFTNCISLVSAPDLKAETLTTKCYYQMFSNCSSLEKLPMISANTLADNCMSYMFYSCSALKLSDSITGECAEAWKLSTATNSSNWGTNMFYGCTNISFKVPVLGKQYYTKGGIPEIKGVSLTLSGKIGVNIYLDVKDYLFDYTYVVINDTEYSLTEATTTEYGYKLTYYTDAKCMGDEIKVSTYVLQGDSKVLMDFVVYEQVTDNYVFCVREYLDVVKESTDPVYANLASALYTYGICAQEYFEYRTEDIDIEVNVADYSFADYAYSFSEKLPDSIVHLGTSLILNTDTTIRHYFYLDGSSEVVFKCGNNELEVQDMNGIYYVDISGIESFNLDKTYTLYLYIDNAVYEVDYSVLSYAYEVTDSDNIKLKKLCNALYSYNLASKAYMRVYDVAS